MGEENNSEEQAFAKEVGKTFILSFAATAGATVGMIIGVVALGYAAKKIAPVSVTTTPSVTE